MTAVSRLQVKPGKSPETQMVFAQMEVRVLIDSGASVNVIHQNIFKQVQKGDNTVRLLSTKAKICAYGSKDPIELQSWTKLLTTLYCIYCLCLCLTLRTKNHVRFMTICPPRPPPPNTMLNICQIVQTC